MVKATIDGIEIEVEDGTSIFSACRALSIEIPHFCYHKRLKVAGNCRMCLVEVEKFPKPVASCSMNVTTNMVIHTDSEMVKKAREGVMEFLLINHPLDCPICDEAGECNLQDQAFKYGKNVTKFAESKRIVADKYLGPLIKTKMTRCIHCTRCIRFATDIAGIEEIGAIYRGEHMEVTSYLEHALDSELSGNMIDLCPVGALNSKPYSSTARSWELKKTNSIDIMDALGSNIRIDSRGSEIMRILPRTNDLINEEWISDKARFSYDGLSFQRITKPYIRIDGKLCESSWEDALRIVASKITSFEPQQIAGIAGSLACLESMFILKRLLTKLKITNYVYEFDYKFDTSSRSNYLFNSSIDALDKADLCLLIGANPRKVAPVLNARIGRQQRSGQLKVGRIGNIFDETYKIQELGDDPNILYSILRGEHKFSEELSLAKHPIIIIGDGVYSREDSRAVQVLIHEIIRKYEIADSGFNMLHNHAAIVGSLDIGFYKDGYDITQIMRDVENDIVKFIYLLNSDEIDLENIRSKNNCFIVYQGHHFDRGASVADVLLPATSYTEKDAIYVNLEGRPQNTKQAVKVVGITKDDWVIIRDLSRYVAIDLDISSLQDLRKKLSAEFPVFSNIGMITNIPKINISNIGSRVDNIPIIAKESNYYMTNSISRASVTMANVLKSRMNSTH